MKKIYSFILSAAIIPVLIPVFSAAQISNSSGPGKIASSKIHNYFVFPERIKADDYEAKTVVLKVKPQHSKVCSLTSLNNYLLEIGAKPVKRKFPHAQKPVRDVNAQGLKFADLTRIFQFTYSADIPLEDVINTVYAMNIVEYAEPNYIPKLLYTPNDPSISSQWHLTKIKAQQAWDISKGDTNVVIGIVDSEIQWNHPDLTTQVKYNYADPIDGVDNEGDGYIDNYRGYDVGEGDNNTVGTTNIHGSLVAGDAAAATDNATGVAGPAFKCKILPVKISNSSGSLIAGYEGITYAADHGAKIINCSWGSTGGGQSGQDVIDYVTINKDALVVAAAGNDANEVELFPAAYNYVLSVAATTTTDKKASFSSYGTWVDVSAPGQGIYATNAPSGYTSSDGTSMASPVTAGAAALVKAQYPFLTALQVGEQMRVSCDPMSTESQWVAGKMGKGRINLFTSVSGISSPSIIMTNKVVTDNGDEAFVAGDTLAITGTFVNYLIASGNVTATLTTTTGTYITIADGTTSLGSIAMMSTVINSADPFKVVIKPGTPLNAKANFVVSLTDGSYSSKAYFSITINVDYINIAINEVATSITSKSLIGFNDFSTQLEGLGFRYMPGDGENLLFDGGLMVGVSGKVSDNVRSSPNPNDADFVSVSRVTKVQPIVSEFDVKGIFNDAGAATGSLPVQVSHKAFAWNKPGHRRYVMVEYSIKNTGASPLNSLWAGIYTDWDISMGDAANGYNNNKAATDVARGIGYSYNLEQGGFYAGVQVLTTTNSTFNHYAMDHVGTSGVNPNTSYTTAEKYTSLSTMRNNAGAPNDVSSVVSGGPFDIPAGDSVTIAFALLAGDDLTDLQKTADSACANYPFSLLATTTSPACGNNNGSASVSVVGCGSLYSYQWSDGQTTATASGLGAGNYTVTVTNPYGRKSSRIVSISNISGPSLSLASTIVSCGATNGTVTATVTGGTSPYSFVWSNGATTPDLVNLNAGDYLVSVTDANNCLATGSVTVNSASDLLISATTTDASCGNSDGTATAVVSGGTSPYAYLWSNGATTSQITGLAAQTYTVTVTDANSCAVPISTTVYSQSSLSVAVSKADASAYGVCDGSATATVSGGTTPFTYAWTDSQVTPTATGLCAGDHYVTVTDVNLCSTVSSATVSQPLGIKGAYNAANAGFNIYPNPASGVAIVQFIISSSEKNAEFSVYNLLGEKVYGYRISDSRVKGQISVDVSDFESGVYFCRLETSDGMFTRKMTVVK